MTLSPDTLQTDEHRQDEPCPPAQVRIEPAKVDLTVPPGSTLMAAAQGAGIRWPSLCGGQAQCGVCAVEVLDPSTAQPDPALPERQMLARLAAKPRQGGTMRLACQLHPTGEVLLLKAGVRAPAPG